MVQELQPAILDPHTGFLVRADACTGCAMCVLACSSIKLGVFGFANDSSLVHVTGRPEGHGSHDVAFVEGCDACSYCLKFCAFGAIGKPEGWVLPLHQRDRRGGENPA